MSRKAKFTPALKASICREVSLGKSLRKVLKQKGMPSLSRVMALMQTDEAWQEQYARAKRTGIELHIDGMIDLADEATEDNAHAIRLQVDTRKWVASKLLPKIYGDRIAAEITLPDAGPVDRERTLLETARAMAFVLYQANELQRGRETQALLPAPDAEHPSAEPKGVAQGAGQPTHSPTHEAEAAAAKSAPATDQPERVVDHAGRLSDAADAMQSMRTAEPLPIAANRFRPRWQRS